MTSRSDKPSLRGYAGIFRLLAGEHGEVEALMKRVAGAPGDPSIREELFPEIRRRLLAHTQAEEKELYAPLRDFSSTKTLVFRATGQHREVETWLERLAADTPTTPAWLDAFEEMMRVVQAHVAMEENELFPAANDVLSREQATEMQERYEAAEESARARL